MTDFTRVTVVGSVRKAELVLPSDVALATLLPRLLELLDEQPGTAARPLALVRTTGEQLDLALGAADQALPDGELLRLIRRDEAPPPPEIADVTDVLAEQHAARPGRWSPRARLAVGAVATAVAAAATGFALLAWAVERPELVLAAVAAVLLVAGTAVARARRPRLGTTLIAASAGLAPALAWALAANAPAEARTVVAIAATAVLLWVVVLVGRGLGFADRAAGWGAVLGAALALLPAGLLPTGWAPTEIAAVVAVAATVACGVLPWFALSASGLTGLDDQVVEGRARRRDEVLGTVDAAYRTLSWATVAVALPLGGSVFVLLASGEPWAVGLGAAAALVAALRTRAFPLTVQSAVLWSAAVLPVIAGILLLPVVDPVRVGLLAAVAVTAAAAAVLDPPAHRRAALRRVGNGVETVAVIAMLPVLLGVFGIYQDLLEAF